MKTQRPFNFDEAALSQMENIRRIGMRRLHNRSEIDDFVQETLLRAYAKRDQLRDETKFDRWIAAIANNLARDWNSAFYRKGREEPIDELPDIPDERTPHDILEREEERRELHQAMGRLNEDDREMLRARYFEDASYQELQERHGLSYSAVGFRLHRAKARLKKILTSTAAAFIAAFAGMKRAAWGGVLLMTKTTTIAVGTAIVVAGILTGGYIWINSAGEETNAPNDSPLTIEEQSPRITPLSNQKSTSGIPSTETAPNADASNPSEHTQTDSGEGANADMEPSTEALSETIPSEVVDDVQNPKETTVQNAEESNMTQQDLLDTYAFWESTDTIKYLGIWRGDRVSNNFETVLDDGTILKYWRDEKGDIIRETTHPDGAVETTIVVLQ